MLIVIEGLDGAGKSTQVKKLKEYLESLPQKLEYIHFPRYDAPVYGKLISRFLRGDFGSNNAVHPQLVALLYAEDRHGASEGMKKILAEGGNILLDRYVYSNVAYQCAKASSDEEKQELRNWIMEVEYGDFALPKPDLNLFLDVPLSFVEQKLRASRTGGDRDYLEGNKDIHEADMDFQKKVRDVYVQQCQSDPDFIRIDCSDDSGRMSSPDEIFARIKTAVENRLTEKGQA